MSAALRDRGFHAYEGERTAVWTRFLVITRYALEDLLGTRRIIAGLVVSVIGPLVAAVLIYLHHNAEALNITQLPLDRLIPINGGFFLWVLKGQAFVAFFLTLAAGATLISSDMRDNALPLYLGRPLSRFEYVLGKLAVLLVLGSIPTWVLGLTLYGLQVSLTGTSWLGENLVIGMGMFLGSWVLILILGLVCLAISALMRAKAAAEVTFGSFFIALLLTGLAIDGFLGTSWGAQLNLPLVLDAVWRPMFGLAPSPHLTVVQAWTSVFAMIGLSVLILWRRVKAYEVIK